MKEYLVRWAPAILRGSLLAYIALATTAAGIMMGLTVDQRREIGLSPAFMFWTGLFLAATGNAAIALRAFIDQSLGRLKTDLQANEEIPQSGVEVSGKVVDKVNLEVQDQQKEKGKK